MRKYFWRQSMKNKNMVLLKNLLLSTSRRNSFKYCRDKKKRGKIIGSTVGAVILYLMLMAYCVANCIGYGKFGMTKAIPVTCATLVSVLALVFTFFKTNGYLFGFKEYDMLMSLPFDAKTVAGCKFMYMYINSLPWYLSVSVSMMIGYGIFAKPAVLVYPVWLVLSLVLPIIPMLIAAFLGFIIAKLGSGFKNKSIAMTVLWVGLIFACFGLRFFLEDMFKNNKTEEVLDSLSAATDSAGSVYLPIKWFSGAVNEMHISDMLLLIGASLVLFEIVFIPVGRSYRKINSALKSHSARGGYEMTELKKRSPVQAIALKEFKRMTGSTTYMTNAIFGEIACFVCGIAVLFADIDSLLKKMLNGAPLTKEMLYPAIPFVVYFFIGMVATTAFTPSLEGKNYWIVQSLPIKKRTLVYGKMLFNMYLTVPFAVFATVMISISAKAPVPNIIIYTITSIVMCAFSTSWGCVCGIKHMRLDWENEIEVIKQGPAMAIYLFPNMIATMALCVLSVVIGKTAGTLTAGVIMLGLYSVLAALSYLRVRALTKE